MINNGIPNLKTRYKIPVAKDKRIFNATLAKISPTKMINIFKKFERFFMWCPSYFSILRIAKFFTLRIRLKQ